MAKKSAGLLLYRLTEISLEVLLVHPGGPFFAKKDAGAWSIPKGEMEEGEAPLTAAIREVKEETGIEATGDFIALKPVQQKSGKTVYAWAIAVNVDPSTIRSNYFEMEWPPKSGTVQSFPEIDKACWFTAEEARIRIVEAQYSFITQLTGKLLS